MKKTLGLAMVGGLMVLGIGQGQAQTTNSFSLQTLNIALSGFAGGGTNSSAATEKIDTKRVISSLVGSNSTKSKLQFTVNTDGTLSFFVTTGTGKNVTAVDVTPFFSFGTLAGPLSKGKTSYTIDSFSFGATDTNGVALTPVSFTVQGYTTSQANGAFNSQVNGTGADGTSSTVLKGTISATAPSKNVTIQIQGGGGSSTNSTGP